MMLDDVSSIELVDSMGDDLTVVNAARVSMSKYHDKFDPETDERLIRYLARHGHWTPFSQPQLQFRIRMPIFLARQWFRHTVGLTRNETSRRYVTDTPALYLPHEWRGAPPDAIKQGSSDDILADTQLINGQVEKFYEHALWLYGYLLGLGAAPEMARMVLPQSMYTEWIETGSLYAYSRIYGLRAAPDAQWQIQQYAHALGDLISEKFPVSWKYLNGGS